MKHRNLNSAFLCTWICLATCQTALAWNRYGGPNGDFSLSEEQAQLGSTPRVAWRIDLGDGLSSVVTQDDRAYLTYLAPPTEEESELPEQQRSHTEVLAALDCATGEVEWEHRWDAGWLKSQEAFGGKPRAPQATPIVDGDQVIALGFTGWLHCVERETGALRWKLNLVEQFDATPVQFGFSASPLVVDYWLILLAGGQQGGLVALDRKTGKRIWSVPCKEASYATPVLCTLGGERQVVFVTRDFVAGVALKTGQERWRYDLPEAGLTNVPTPLVLQESGNRVRLVISGQGVKGTRELLLNKTDAGTCTVEEGWENGAQFFYCNWVLSDGRILGCTGDLLVALDAQSGKRLARLRGYRDANLLRVGNRFLIVDGEGALSLAMQNQEGITIQSRYQILEERCWAPPTLGDNKLLCRGGTELVCLTFDESQEELHEPRPLEVERPRMAMKAATPIQEQAEAEEEEQDPVDRIVAAFQKSGPEAAWEVYESVRGDLAVVDRKELAALAFEQGLPDLARKILQHSLADFPNDETLKKKVAAMLAKHAERPSPQTTKAKNGLVYVEFGIKNKSWRTIHAAIKGPAKHPFGYGLPLRPGATRIEKWPVGSKLTVEQDGKELLTVRKEFAGKVIEVP